VLISPRLQPASRASVKLDDVIALYVFNNDRVVRTTVRPSQPLVELPVGSTVPVAIGYSKKQVGLGTTGTHRLCLPVARTYQYRQEVSVRRRYR
jgi:hypothetical protein